MRYKAKREARMQQQNSAETVAARTAPLSHATSAPTTLEHYVCSTARTPKPAKEPSKSASTALAEVSSHVADSFAEQKKPRQLWKAELIWFAEMLRRTRGQDETDADKVSECKWGPGLHSTTYIY